ncbi:hypothetical protein [Guggenheimella bovis]
MLFPKKVKRAFDLQKEQNKARYAGREKELEAFNNEKHELEKGDALAIFLSAVIVFGPIFLFFIILLVLVYISM